MNTETHRNVSITAICVLNWNNYPATRRCLQSIMRLVTSNGIRIIIVDNHSDDGSYELLRQLVDSNRDPQLTLLRTDKNRGYAGGNNIAIRAALEGDDVEFVWILNNDTQVAPVALDTLRRCARKRKDVGVWGSTLVNQESGRLESAGGCFYYSFFAAYRCYLAGKTVSEALQARDVPLDYISGASMFVRSNVFRDVGLLNEEFFLFYEELDFVRRIKGRWSLGWCRESIVAHQGGASTARSESAHYHSILSALKYTWLYNRRYLTSVFLVRVAAFSLVSLLTLRKSALLQAFRSLKAFLVWRKARVARFPT